MGPEQIFVAALLALLWLAETWLPFFVEQHATLRDRLRHDLRNFLWLLLNVVLVAAAITGVFAGLDHWAETNNFGLVRQLPLRGWQKTALAVLLMDLWTYWWHRMNHTLPFLWRFHRMHHSDTSMNVSTAARFHTGELILSRLMWLVIVPTFGVSLGQLVVYNLCLQPVVLLHHSNLRLPRWLDCWLTAVLVSPAMHRVHHSRIRHETNSNYGSLFPCWDWLFRSFCWRSDTENIDYGIDELDGREWQTLPGMAKTPLHDP